MQIARVRRFAFASTTGFPLQNSSSVLGRILRATLHETFTYNVVQKNNFNVALDIGLLLQVAIFVIELGKLDSYFERSKANQINIK